MILFGFLSDISIMYDKCIMFTKNRNKFFLKEETKLSPIYPKMAGCYVLYDYQNLYNKIKEDLGPDRFEIITTSKLALLKTYYLTYSKYIGDNFFMIFYSKISSNSYDKKYTYYSVDVAVYLANYRKYSYNNDNLFDGYVLKKKEYENINWKYLVKEIFVRMKEFIKKSIENSIMSVEYCDNKLSYNPEYVDETDNLNYSGFDKPEFFEISDDFDVYNFYFVKDSWGVSYKFVLPDTKKIILPYKIQSEYKNLLFFLSKKKLNYIQQKDKLSIYYFSVKILRSNIAIERSFPPSYYLILLFTDKNGYITLKNNIEFFEFLYTSYYKRKTFIKLENNKKIHILVTSTEHPSGRLYNYFIYMKENLSVYVISIYLILHTHSEKLNFAFTRYTELVVWEEYNKKNFDISFRISEHRYFTNISNNNSFQYPVYTTNIWFLFFVYVLRNNIINSLTYIKCDRKDCDYQREIEEFYHNIFPEKHGTVTIDVGEKEFYWMVVTDEVSQKGVIILIDALEEGRKTIGIIGEKNDIIEIMNEIKTKKMACILYKSYNYSNHNSYGFSDKYDIVLKEVIFKTETRIYASVKLCE